MCSHFLVEPVACTPAAGWEKGQVENQVGTIRGRFFIPRLRAKSFEELNAWLLEQCIAYAKVHHHPEFRTRTIWQVFEEERQSLAPYAGRFPACSRIAAKIRHDKPDLRSFAPAGGETGALDQISDDHRQDAARQGYRRLRVRRLTDQRDSGA
jgi:hypothetical protein